MFLDQKSGRNKILYLQFFMAHYSTHGLSGPTWLERKYKMDRRNIYTDSQ